MPPAHSTHSVGEQSVLGCIIGASADLNAAVEMRAPRVDLKLLTLERQPTGAQCTA